MLSKISHNSNLSDNCNVWWLCSEKIWENIKVKLCNNWSPLVFFWWGRYITICCVCVYEVCQAKKQDWVTKIDAKSKVHFFPLRNYLLESNALSILLSHASMHSLKESTGFQGISAVTAHLMACRCRKRVVLMVPLTFEERNIITLS